MTAKGFTFRHLETDGDVEQELDLMRRVFGEHSGVEKLVAKLIDRHPSMSLGNHFLIEHRGEIVACLILIPVEWSIGGTPLKVAEMGCVGTVPEFRRRGLIRRLVEEYHREVAEQGYVLSVIEGIPFFYRQFGYEYAIPLNEETRIELEKIPSYEPEHEIRPFERRDIPKAMRLLDHSQRRFYVHSVRSERIWEIQHETGIDSERFQAYVVEEGNEMVAYLRITEKPVEKILALREVSEADHSTAKSILSFLKGLGAQSGLEALAAQVSYMDPLTEQLVSLGGVQQTPYAWQIRITDYVEIFQKIKPLLENRLAESAYNSFRGGLNFNFRRFTVRLALEDGLIEDIGRSESSDDRTIGLNPLAFTQLLTGYRSREELEAIYPDFRIGPSHKPLIDVLFPKFPSYIHAAY